ncbi:tRNA (5-methylaminomethyl-2-thiouridine)(34)-methyltransferase MnmD [Oceaniglobus ichthyenteri]|uniref:tRNA (5-methylaminomethyl-2-thiouridine)(34)-methyltransferase MnmD n=1 Tax=Oceaniglobus ichthyenteri TaxID=2136177 RepID=UPI000D34D4F1|nr:tRNA (5-methylaminomethyl-2-thiouridine)(34)-methyltransferase MnmD [Oceaniglobus ichthyenteri]
MHDDHTPDTLHPVEWRDGHVPVSCRFDDPYFSLDDGLAETGHVFLAGNTLPQRFCDGFHIAELGFGTGLNLLATVQMWRGTGQTGTLHFTTFEAFPLSAAQIKQAHRAFPELAGLSRDLDPVWQMGPGRITLPGLHFELIPGDARATLPYWPGAANAWFLDGFSPAKNPELWAPDLMSQVARHTAPGGSIATYTAAGHVRRALGDAGFTVTRRPGYGRKRHMTTATLDSPR